MRLTFCLGRVASSGCSLWARSVHTIRAQSVLVLSLSPGAGLSCDAQHLAGNASLLGPNQRTEPTTRDTLLCGSSALGLNHSKQSDSEEG